MKSAIACLLFAACANSEPLPTCASLGCDTAPWGEYSGPESSWTPCTDPDLCYCPSAQRETPEEAACRPEAPQADIKH
jgi:hypothetical protein